MAPFMAAAPVGMSPYSARAVLHGRGGDIWEKTSFDLASSRRTEKKSGSVTLSDDVAASGLPLRGVELRVGFATQIVIALNRMSAAKSLPRYS
jgi:hypothetical protein